MQKSQLELLVLYQDMNIMLKEAEEEKERLGFSTKGMKELKEALEELAKKIDKRYLRAYERISIRYKHSIAPVKNNTCLGCFAKLPTSYLGPGRSDEKIITCEHCGRILYWID